MRPATLRFSLMGCVIGATLNAIGVGLFALDPNRLWALQLTQFFSWLGFWVTRDWYGGLPSSASSAVTNSVLIASGALQWGLFGLIVDLCRLGAARRGRTGGR